jgi:Cu/Zn superoxide dismutase
VRQILILLLCTMTLSAIFFFVVGCSSSGTQGQGGQQEDHTTHHQSANVMLNLHPEGNSGVSGTASFEDTSDGVLVKLELRNLPKPDTFYLAHIHPGSCAEGEYGHEHGGSSHEHGGGTHEHGAAEIEYPLSQVKSDTEGRGSSTTTLHETSVDELFSGAPKHVNVHEAGSGNPPILSCADLKRAG